MNLILIGMPMSGKSYFGEILSQNLGWGFLDTDRLIEDLYLKENGQAITCRNLSLKKGESVFREWEKKVISHVVHEEQKVIATGGGSLLCSENRNNLKKAGVLIYLKTPILKLLERLNRKQTIPSYIDPANPRKSLEDLEKQRVEIYEKSADFIVDTDSIEKNAVVNVIISKILGEHHGK